ncbi:MAG: PKD domain-containing protein, partial [Crocinitomicaceae bacterium]|nr:PKD domain-containing protein [Crocinitomicaceae bacterium]
MDTNLIICDASFITWANGNTTNFVNTSSGSNLSYYWDFGDGNSSSSSDVSHTYTSPGTYLACLTIWSNDSLNNCSDTTCQYITIIDSLNPCQAIFVLSQNGNTIDCSNSSTGNNLSYYWNFGDGN